MLKTTQTRTINGSSITEDGMVIATMHCSIDANGAISTSENVSNVLLYEANKDIVRADMDEFTTYCRQIEDETNGKEEETE